MIFKDFKIAHLTGTSADHVRCLKKYGMQNTKLPIKVESDRFSAPDCSKPNSIIMTMDLNWYLRISPINTFLKTGYRGFYLIDYRPKSSYSTVMFKVILKCLKMTSE